MSAILHRILFMIRSWYSTHTLHNLYENQEGRAFFSDSVLILKNVENTVFIRNYSLYLLFAIVCTVYTKQRMWTKGNFQWAKAYIRLNNVILYRRKMGMNMWKMKANE